MDAFTLAGSGQILGRREEQQDALGFGTVALADGRRAPLAVLADGMGGHHGGAIAARLAIETFLGSCRASPARTFTGALESALLDANRALAARSREDARLAQMGCTLIATAVEGGVLHYVSVGDSLLWRVGAERIERLNADHSMMPVVTTAVAQGKMTHAEAQAHCSILRSAVTGRPIDLVDLRSVELARNEWVLLASDGILSLYEAGVHGFVGPAGAATAQARVDALLDAVEQVGEPEQDNCTVVLLPMAAAPAKSARRPLAVVLGTLAIVAGLGVVGAAGWELLRLGAPLPSDAVARVRVPSIAARSEATTAKPPLPASAAPDRQIAGTGTSEATPPSRNRSSRATDKGADAPSSPSATPTRTPTPKPKPTPSPTPLSSPSVVVPGNKQPAKPDGVAAEASKPSPPQDPKKPSKPSPDERKTPN